VTLPELGESVTEGTVSRWLKQVGESVKTDEPLLEVSTDKVDTEIPSPAAGTLLEIRVQEDETVEVGAILAVIGEREPLRQHKKGPAQQRRRLPSPSLSRPRSLRGSQRLPSKPSRRLQRPRPR
jgi:2-oxoglutarate dehydrogenase E2 component (dihydrolipoamide succinyltransferase)